MKLLRAFICFFMLASIATASARSIDEIPNVHLTDRTRFVSDPDNYLSAAAMARADSIIASVWNASSAELAVVIVKDIDDNDPDEFATDLFRQWQIGKKDNNNGVLLLVSVDDHSTTIRTGYGIEGVLPDAVTGRISRNVINPYFREGDFDGGIVAGVSALRDIITSPENAAELMSQYENDADAHNDDTGGFFSIYLVIGLIVLGLIILLSLVTYFKTSDLDRHERYAEMKKLWLPSLVASVGFIGIPLVGFLLLSLLMRHVRRSKAICPNCSARMQLIDEVHDNDYLTPAQDSEERLGSVDYDVWHCDNCGTVEVLPYINTGKNYSVCPNCGARTEEAVSNRIVKQPTTTAEGVGVKDFECKNCGNHRQSKYRIAKLAAAATGPIILGGGRGFGGGGGGFSGGSFGGGWTGGGGTTVRW